MTWEQAFWTAMTVVGTLLAKWVWDRWLSKNSRITAELCGHKRAECVGRIMTAIEKHTDRLSGGDECFQEIGNNLKAIKGTLAALTYINLTFCQKLQQVTDGKGGLDCDELARMLVKIGVME